MNETGLGNAKKKSSSVRHVEVFLTDLDFLDDFKAPHLGV